MKTKYLALTFVLFSLFTGLVGCGGGRLYTALGASDAVGVGAFPLRKGYVFRIKGTLEARLPDEEVNSLNLGIPAAKIGKIKDVVKIIAATEVRPDLITIWAGANDLVKGESPRGFETDLKFILDELRSETSAFIVIGDIPDLTRLPRFIDKPDPDVTLERVAAFNDAITRQANDFDVPIARISQMDRLEDFTNDIDGFHPNNKGHERIAQIFLDVILPGMGLDN